MTPKTLLLRQVNPSFVQRGRLTSQVFQPTRKDDKKLSVYDGDLITPEASWEHYTQTPQFTSVGVMAVSVEECSELGLTAEPDPEPFPEHAVINFSDMAGSQIKHKAKSLKAAAEARNWLYQVGVD